MYMLHSNTWHVTLVRSLVTSIKDTSTTFITNDFLTRREEVSKGLFEEVTKRLNSLFDNAIKLESFYLRKISFEKSYEDIV